MLDLGRTKLKKVGVIHSVAINGGDQLLLDALVQGLEAHCGAEVVFVTTNNYLSYPFISKGEVILNSYFDKDFDLPFRIKRLAELPLIGGLIRRLFLSLKGLSRLNRELNEVIDSVDCVILMPGGFLHEYYDYFRNLAYVVDHFKTRGKKIFIIGQSIGPFDRNPEEAIAFLSGVEKIILRERFSKEFVSRLQDPTLLDKVLVTSDIAFGYPSSRCLSGRANNKVFMNFRLWEGRDEFIKSRAVFLIRLITSLGYCVEMISTCQGLEAYRDDSVLHDEILRRCMSESSELGSVVVNRAKYSPSNLITYLSENGTYYVGMRLHMTISALLAGLPVLNFGYEPKNIGVLETVGLAECAADFFGSESNVREMVAEFLDSDHDAKARQVNDAVRLGRRKFQESFDFLNREMS